MNVQIEMPSLDEQILQLIKDALPQQQFIGFADVDEFIKISGISSGDMEKKVLPDPRFQEHVTRFGKGHKRYIKVMPALKCIEEELMIKESEL